MGLRFAQNSQFAGSGPRLNFDARDFDGYAVTTSDSADLPNGICRGIYVTGAGNVNVNLESGGTAVLTGLSAGQFVRISVSRILATSTTATGIYALY
jgi:hypothetical protein